MQGSSIPRWIRARVAATFSVAFVLAALLTFTSADLAARALGMSRLPLAPRIAIAAAGLLALAMLDVRAMRRSTYCPLGWRRQTPRALLRRHSMFVVAGTWGLDTGLVVTTFRVAAVSWGALLLAALGLSSPWAGVAYGLGFTVPFLVLVIRPRLGDAARAGSGSVTGDPGLEPMLRLRPVAQALSAALLVASCGILFGQLASIERSCAQQPCVAASSGAG